VIPGAHVSTSGGIHTALERAEQIGAESVQIFTQSPRTWRPTNHDPANFKRFKERRSEADGVVFHVGSHLGAGFDAGLEHVVPALERALERCSDTTWLLIENSAGAGGTIGRSVDELAVLVDRLGGHSRLGICLDSCHLLASGYDIRTAEGLAKVVDECDETIGLDRLRCIHVNDSQAPLGSNRDRHANLPDGELGARGLSAFLSEPRFEDLPALLEVPGTDGKGPDAAQVAIAKKLRSRGLAARKRNR
jgi:deoxyribonuclease-4